MVKVRLESSIRDCVCLGKAVRTVLNDMSGRAEPFVEQRDEGGSDDYYSRSRALRKREF